MHIKEKEGTLCTFNISVAFTDEFMSQVVNDSKQPWMGKFNGVPMFPRRIKRNQQWHFVSAEDVKLTAREIMEEIALCAWRNGEPGCAFIDTINRTNPLPGLGRIEASNPCVTADTWIDTTEGPKQVSDLIGVGFYLPMADGSVAHAPEGFFSTGGKRVVRIRTVEGYEITCTENHRLMVPSGRWVEAKNLMPGNELLLDKGARCVNRWKGTGGTGDDGYTVGMFYGEEHMDDAMEKRSSGFYLGFLRGLFDTYAEVVGAPNSSKGSRVLLTLKTKSVVRRVQRMLLRIGIESSFMKRIIFPEQTTYELRIDKQSMARFCHIIGFRDANKQKHLDNVLRGYSRGPYADHGYGLISTIERVKQPQEVYDVTVEHQDHCYASNGFRSHNCGEQYLHDGEPCNLGALNIEKHVSEDGIFEWEKLKRTTWTAVRMLDNTIDASSYPTEKVEKMSKATRRVGLGIFGFADALYKMKIGYNTEEGLRWAEIIMKFITEEAWKCSFALAREKEPFPYVDKSVWATKRDKPRNCAVTNIAPTGTTSMIFDVSSGVEPYFALAYWYKGILGGEVRLDYVNKHLQRALEEANLASNKRVLEEILKKGSLQHIDLIPPHIKKVFVTAMDMSVEWHIRMQAAFQKYCSNAISKVFLPPLPCIFFYSLSKNADCKRSRERNGRRHYELLHSSVEDGMQRSDSVQKQL